MRASSAARGESSRCEKGNVPGAYQHAPSFFSARVFSNTSMASCEQPMLLPSATNFTPLSTSFPASSPLTSFCVAHGSATSTFPTCTHGRAPSTYFSFPSKSAALATESSALRSTLSAAILWICSGVMPELDSAGTIRAPLESESETTVPPSSITLSAAYWATLPEPDTATRLPEKDSAPLETHLIICSTY